MPVPIVVPGTRVSLLSAPGKMRLAHPDWDAPGQDRRDPARPYGRLIQAWSWSLPALQSCPWAETHAAPDGSPAVCAGCYATHGRYLMPSVSEPQRLRYAWTRESLRTPAGTAEWVSVMVAAIRSRTAGSPSGARYFRVHDSGDFFSPQYTHAWAAVIRRTPTVRYWAPTRSWRALIQTRGETQSRWHAAFADVLSLENLTCRPSMLWVGGAVIDVAALTSLPFAAGTTVQRPSIPVPQARTCPAPSQGGVCGPCSTCWMAPATAVAYVLH